jgi:hypothetical protein
METLFLSSPNEFTPYHIDSEDSFLLQIQAQRRSTSSMAATPRFSTAATSKDTGRKVGGLCQRKNSEPRLKPGQPK